MTQALSPAAIVALESRVDILAEEKVGRGGPGNPAEDYSVVVFPGAGFELPERGRVDSGLKGGKEGREGLVGLWPRNWEVH